MADKELKSLNFGGEDTYFPLPLVTSEDNDKILAVVDGDWSATTPENLGYLNTSDATIEPLEVMNGEVAYGPEGQVVGTAPFEFNGTEIGIGLSDWAQIELPVSARWQSVTYADDKFIAIGSEGMAYSEDGINWTQTETAVGGTIAYGDGKFVAISYDIAVYSTDGITWTQSTLPELPGLYETAGWQSVTYGDGKFVAISCDFVFGNTAAYSEDGITWHQTTLPIEAVWTSVTYGDGKFAAVGYDVAAYSTDGITWTQSTMPEYARLWSVTYGNGKFVAVDNEYNNTAVYSTDGITWEQTAIVSSEQWWSVTYGDGKFVAIAYDSDIAAYSTDGITWIKFILPTSANWYSVAYGDGKFIAVAYNNSNIAAYCEVEEVSVYKLIETTTLSAENCENRTLSIENNEIVLDSMFVDEETGV